MQNNIIFINEQEISKQNVLFELMLKNNTGYLWNTWRLLFVPISTQWW